LFDTQQQEDDILRKLSSNFNSNDDIEEMHASTIFSMRDQQHALVSTAATNSAIFTNDFDDALDLNSAVTLLVNQKTAATKSISRSRHSQSFSANLQMTHESEKFTTSNMISATHEVTSTKMGNVDLQAKELLSYIMHDNDVDDFFCHSVTKYKNSLKSARSQRKDLDDK
jgi:hypothetical protein